MKKIIPFIIFFALSGHSIAQNVFKKSADIPIDQAYTQVSSALGENNFWVVDEINIGKSLARFEEKWGDDYNQQKLKGIRVMLACNGWYANQVSNKDPDMLALCPVRITVYQKENTSTVVFARPSVIAADSPALPVIKEVEAIIIKSINEGLK
ncbi:MAG: DUF302 domain-containing protein [bacterium]